MTLDRDDVLLTGDDVRLEPGCVLDASRGPVVIGRGARVGAGSVLEGPCYVGDYTRVAPLTAIRSGTTIGPACNIGGAVSNSIILGFSDLLMQEMDPSDARRADLQEIHTAATRAMELLAAYPAAPEGPTP